MDIDSGKILASKNENNKYEPASITKILTALIVIEKGNLNDKITGKAPATLEEGSSIYLKDGEVMTVEQLLYGLMLKSGNDAATALAEYISGSKEAFAVEMNKRAQEIGVKNSNFTNPHGLNDDNHYTTPSDYALIAREAMKNPVFKKIASTVTYRIPASPQFPEERVLINHNKLISTQTYKYDDANGIKTGFTKRSLHTFVGSATRGKTNLLVVTMRNASLCYGDTKTLFDYGFNTYETKVVVEKDKPIGYMELENKTDISLIPTQGVTHIFNKSNPDKITKDIKYIDIKSFDAGDVVAKLEVKVNGEIIQTVDLKSDKEYKTLVGKGLEKVGISSTNKYIVGIVAVVVLLLAALILRRIRVKKRKKRVKKTLR